MITFKKKILNTKKLNIYNKNKLIDYHIKKISHWSVRPRVKYYKIDLSFTIQYVLIKVFFFNKNMLVFEIKIKS